MKLKFNRNTELWVVNYGVFQPKKEIEVSEELGKMMLGTGYFDEVKEKEIKIKRKKSKKKGDD